MNLDDMRKKMEEAKAAMKAHGREALSEELKGFFKANPSVKAIRWRQYTPYFNDGEPCLFNVYDPSFQIEDPTDSSDDHEDEDEDEDEYEDDDKGFVEVWSFRYDLKGASADDPRLALCESMQKLSGMICSSEIEDVFLLTFGDHVKVTATLKDDAVDFEVDDYDHD